MLDAGDMLLRLQNLRDDSARTALNDYLSRLLSIFDAPIFTVVDRGTNLANKYMADNLRYFESQLCSIPTEAPWSIGNNERSHRFLHKAISRTISDLNFDVGDNLERLLGEIEMAWNFTQHVNRTLPHFNHFGVIPRVLGELVTSPTIQDCIALMEMAGAETTRARAEQVISSALNSARRHLAKLCSFNVGQTVWFHRRNFGWRKGTVARINRLTIFVSSQSKFYPTHETRVRTFFGDSHFPPEIRSTDSEELERLDKLSPAALDPIPSSPAPTHSTAPTVQLLSATFIASDPPAQSLSTISTDDGILLLHVSPSDTGIVDSIC